MNNESMITQAQLTSSKAMPIDFGRNFPPPSLVVERALTDTFAHLGGTNIADAIRFPRFMGTVSDREAAATWISRRLGQTPHVDRVVLTNGSQSILAMLMARFVRPGGVLLTEELTYPAIKPLSALFGIELRAVAMDAEGIDPGSLDRTCVELGDNARALYCMPTLHNPTSATMSEARRKDIATVVRRHDLWVFEDDIYGILPQQAPPPLALYAPERSWYILGLSKSLAAQLRVAYVVAPNSDVARDAFWPGVRTTNWMVAPLVAEVTARWLASGIGSEILQSVRIETLRRRALAASILPHIQISNYHLWIELPEAWQLNSFVKSALDAGVVVGRGDSFAVNNQRGDRMFRIGLGVPPDQDELVRGLRAVGSLLDTSSERVEPMKGRSLSTATTGDSPTNDTDLHVCFISEEAGFDLRTTELAPAPAKPIPAYPDAKVAFHVGAYCGSTLASVATFVLEDMESAQEGPSSGRSWRIHGMATAKGFRRVGFASAVLDHGLREIRRRGGLLVWCTGRTTASSFYLHHGFDRIGEERHVPRLPPHYRFKRTIGWPHHS
ncbi:aminotransferase class I/II-fold pyridoxal phosphate-dependent enzyme [Bradyrhizobium sp. Arg62]|uniref:aminotransferase class I/II-fold pyridoxal phosphate-dependent enzyme n=1 Tax=Bradyrhizobium brasilense TaxID=1419277 RepID=UPI001E5C6BE5|nr:aminotransferase class I/II-fold pyridoxal phosphate-dependent enzyme [Bradyrhizobium brasilense]MCC8948624.1 aminotransferase class I/II-fold pyridoxal phosphate-dependent enzyme [Bradyrhizobium brasilense]